MAAGPPREILVFVSYENEAPAPLLARQLVDALGASPVALGTDALTGGVELRLHYHPSTLEAARAYLDTHRIAYDLELLH